MFSWYLSWVFLLKKSSLAVKLKTIWSNEQVPTNNIYQMLHVRTEKLKFFHFEATSALTVRRRKAKFACRDTQNSINWLRLYAQWPRSLSKGEAAKPDSFTDYHWENKIYKKIDICNNNNNYNNNDDNSFKPQTRQNQNIHWLLFLYYIYNQEHGKVRVIHWVAVMFGCVLDASSFC